MHACAMHTDRGIETSSKCSSEHRSFY